jgi:hypothetical protein
MPFQDSNPSPRRSIPQTNLFVLVSTRRQRRPVRRPGNADSTRPMRKRLQDPPAIQIPKANAGRRRRQGAAIGRQGHPENRAPQRMPEPQGGMRALLTPFIRLLPRVFLSFGHLIPSSPLAAALPAQDCGSDADDSLSAGACTAVPRCRTTPLGSTLSAAKEGGPVGGQSKKPDCALVPAARQIRVKPRPLHSRGQYAHRQRSGHRYGDRAHRRRAGGHRQKLYLQLKSSDSYLRKYKRDGAEIFTSRTSGMPVTGSIRRSRNCG